MKCEVNYCLYPFLKLNIVQYAFQLPTKGRIFGVPLCELTEKCDNSANVPNIVFQLVAFIRRHGFQGL